VLDRERVQLRDDLTVPPRPHVGVDAGLDRRQAKLGQTGDLTVEKAVGFDVGVGMAAPQRQRPTQPLRGVLGFSYHHGGTAGVLERDGVDRRRRAIEQVPVAPADDHVAEGVTKVGDIGVHGRPVGRRRIRPLDGLEQRVHQHGPTGGRDQDRNDRPLLRTARGDRRPISEHLHGPQRPVLHGRT
jgi:hypothetical protein